MANITDFGEKLLLDWCLTGGAATRPSAWGLAIGTGVPTDSTFVEATGLLASPRVTVGFAQQATGTLTNSVAVTFGTFTAAGTVSAAGLSTGSSLPVSATITASGVVGKSTGAAVASTATLTAAGTVGRVTGSTFTTTATLTAGGIVGRATGATVPLAVTFVAAGAVAIERRRRDRPVLRRRDGPPDGLRC